MRSSSLPAGSPGDRRRVEVQGVVHVHRRMVGREVEREEVVPLGLDLGARGDGEAELTEDADDLVHDPRHRVLGADPAPAAGHGEVHARGLLPPPLGRERLRALGESRLEPRLELVHRRAVALPLLDAGAPPAT